MDAVDRFFIMLMLDANYPWVHRICNHVPITSVRRFVNTIEEICEVIILTDSVSNKFLTTYQYGRVRFEEYIAKNGRHPKRKDLLTKILTVDEEGNAPLTDHETYTELGNLIFAGTGRLKTHIRRNSDFLKDTTSVSLTYLFWELAKHQDWQIRLREELRSVHPDTMASIPSYHTIADLPVLDAIINESLRLHPAAPASLPRMTPPGGSYIGGHHIPKGVCPLSHPSQFD